MNWYDLDPEELNRRLSALAGLRDSAEKAALALSQFGTVATPLEEWPDVVLEDILDAEVVGE